VIIHIDLTFIVELLLFGGFFFLLNRVFYGPFLAVSRQRATQIDAGVRAAEESQRRAEETARLVQLQLDGARAEAQGIIAAANKTAATHRQTLLEEAKAETDVVLEKARGEIRAERVAAVEQVRAEVAPLAVLIAARVTDGALDTQDNHQKAERIVAAQGGEQIS